MVYDRNKKFIETIRVNWNSVTSATSSGTNLKDEFPYLWKDIINPNNKYKYYLEAITTSVSNGTMISIIIPVTNQLDTKNSRKVYLTGANSVYFFSYSVPETKIAIEASIMINESGECRFYVSFNGALNSNFKIEFINVYKVK